MPSENERVGKRGWRIWKEKNLPQEVVPLSDAEGVVAQIETENDALCELLMEAKRLINWEGDRPGRIVWEKMAMEWEGKCLSLIRRRHKRKLN